VLTTREGCDARAAAAVLSHINSLYTVYHSIVLFDSGRRVVAVSRDDQAELVGTRIDESWAADALGLLDSQSYAVSRFHASVFAKQQLSLIYAAAVRGSDRRVVGGVAVVCDTGPQLHTMLLDALPRNERGEPVPGCIGLFLDRDGHLMGSTDPSLDASSEMLQRVREKLASDGAHVIRVGHEYYALGTKSDNGYREYVGIGAHAVVLLPLGAVPERAAHERRPLPQCTAARSDHARHDVRELTTFSTAGTWYALPTSCVLEAVDGKLLQTITTAGPPWAGVIMHGEDAVPVVNLATLLDLPSVESSSVVILVRVEGRARPLGILVEALGDNPEVPGDRLLPITTASMLVEHAIQPVNERDGLVLVLNTTHLAATLFGTAGRAQQAA
jgi:chemotaxis signal transduction protein